MDPTIILNKSGKGALVDSRWNSSLKETLLEKQISVSEKLGPVFVVVRNLFLIFN